MIRRPDPVRRLRWLSAACLLLSSIAATAAPEPCRLPQMEIPVRLVDQRPIATLTLNGTPVPMLVDSGAFFSFLSAPAAEQLNLAVRRLPPGTRIDGITGRIDAQLTRVAKVGLLGAELSDVDFIVGGNEIGAGIMGLLGRNILSAGDTEYDLANGVIRLSFPKGDCDDVNFAHWAGKAPVVVVPLDNGWSRGDTAIRLRVAINGERTRALLDTGAPQTSLTLRAAHRAGLQDADLVPHGRIGGAGEGRANAWTALVRTFELGGEKIENNRLQVDDVSDGDHDMLIGLDYFLAHHIYVSRLQGKAYVTWNGGAPFALNQRAPGRYDTQYAAVPEDVSRDDADALARHGAAAIAAGDLATALKDLDRACELAPGSADYFFDRARLHLRMNHPRLALADLDRALEIAPALAEPRLRRAALRTALGDRPGALDDLAQLDARSPPSLGLRADMAHLYASFGQPAPALRQFDLWLASHRRDARRANVLNDRCWMRARLDIQLPQALQDCKDAIDIDEGEASIRDSLGWTYLRLGDPTHARQAFDEAIRLRAGAFSLYGRAVAERQLADPAGAERDLAAARRLKPSIDADVRTEGFDFAAGAAEPLAGAGS